MFWLVVALGSWYLLVPILHWPIRWCLSGMALTGVPSFLTEVRQTLTGFEFTTSLSPGQLPGQPFRPDATIATVVDARLYSYGAALFAALTLAAWEPARWRHLLVGWVVLLPFQTLAVYAVAMKQIVLDGGPPVAAQTEWARWQIEAIAYLYQFSTLIMPPVTAIAVWLVLHRSFVERFVGADVLALIRSAGQTAERARTGRRSSGSVGKG